MIHVDDMACQDVVELVTDYLELVLPPDVRERFEEHLKVCDGCQIYLGQMRLTVGALKMQRPAEVPEEMREMLSARFAAWRDGRT